MSTPKIGRACELCYGEAATYCAADSAFLCWACDARVHAANFLAARHARRLLCAECGSFDDDDLPVSGPGFLHLPSVCRSCKGSSRDDSGFSDSESESSACSSSSHPSSVMSSCVSGAESGGAGKCTLGGRAERRRWSSRRAAARAELDSGVDVVLAGWCRRLGLDGTCAPSAASRALTEAASQMGAVPLRACAAAAVWSAAKICCAAAGRGAALLKRLEACSGVPAKLIEVAEARLSRALRRRKRNAGPKEGWAECP